MHLDTSPGRYDRNADGTYPTVRPQGGRVKTHKARPVPTSYASHDWLPTLSRMVGDSILYLTMGGDLLSPERALYLLRQGQTVMYETWADADA